jgi:hypothetical protein
MRLLLVSAVPLFIQVAAGAVIRRDDDSQPPICPNLHVKGGGCIRCNFTWQLPSAFG